MNSRLPDLVVLQPVPSSRAVKRTAMVIFDMLLSLTRRDRVAKSLALGQGRKVTS